MSELATVILLILPVPIAYHYGKLAGNKKVKIKTLLKARNYPKGLIE